MVQQIKEALSSNRHIICLGEDARYDFAKGLAVASFKQQISKEESRKYTLWMYRNEEADRLHDVEEEENKYLPSTSIPHKSVVQVPGNNKIKKELIEKRINAKIYIFEQYPYGKDTTRSLLRECMNQYPWAETKVVLWQEERKFGATDISDEKTAMKVAQARFNEIMPNCAIVENEAACKHLFYTQFQYTLQMGHEYKENIEKLEQDMASVFDDYYYLDVESVLEDEILTLQQLDKYCRYESIRNMEDIWQSYCYNFQRYALRREGIVENVVYELYESMIQDICVWNLEEDLKSLRKEIEQCFYKKVVLKQHKTVSLKQCKNEMDYRIQMAKNPIDVTFKEELQQFVSDDLKHCIAKYIETKLKEIQG